MEEMKKVNTSLSEINVTPFVDVMLVLLVIFMVTAPLMEKEIDIDLPLAEAKDVDPTPAAVITYKKNKRVYFNKKRVDFKELESFLRKTYKGKKNREVLLRADKSLSYGDVVEIMAVIKKAGIDKLGMVTEGEGAS